jgi:hypothetical protein
MGNLIKRVIKSLTHSDNDILTWDVYREHVYMGLTLKLEGEINVSSTITLIENGILNLVKNIQLKADGTLTPIDMNGTLAYLRAKYEGQVSPSLSQPGTGTGVQAFSCSIPIKFILPPSYGDMRYGTAFNSAPFKTLTLAIKTGAASDVFSAGAGTLQNFTYKLHTQELKGLEAISLNMNMQNQQDRNFSSASTTLEQELPEGELLAYRSIALRVLNNGVQSDALLNSLSLRSGTEIFVDIPFKELIDNNKEDYHLEALTTGFAILDLDTRHQFADMVRMQGRSNLKFVFDVNAPTSSTGLIEILPSTLILNQEPTQ